MAIKYLEYDHNGIIGREPIIQSDELLAYCSNSSNLGQYVDSYGNLTLIGSGFNEIVPFSSIKCTGKGSSGKYPNGFIDNKIKSLFPDFYTLSFSTDSSTKITTPFTIASNIEYRVQSWSYNRSPRIDVTLYINNSSAPGYMGGMFTVYYADDRNFTVYYQDIIITNSDISRVICIRLTFYNSNGTVNAGNATSPTASTLRTIWDYLSDGPAPPGPTPEEDPYLFGGVTEKEGGEGDFDTFSDEIPVPELPTITVDNTGFISLYSPSVAQLKSLASYLWASTGLDLETFKRIFTDPISTILGLTIVPVTPPTSGSNNVVLGNVDTGVSMPRISNQYVQFDCGTLNVNEFWGGYLDYSPYTSLEIYLPFIGTKPLNIDDVMGHTIHVVYNIDLLSGACCAIIESARRVLYQFIGQCSCSVPVTGRDMTNLINGILSVVGAGAGTFVATGGNPGLSGASAIGTLASNVTKSKPKVEKSGSLGSMGGMLGVRCPYLIITRPRQALPVAQNTYTGYPSFITCVLSELVGYTEVYKIHLGDIPATDAEKTEIETLLMNGVIL